MNPDLQWGADSHPGSRLEPGQSVVAVPMTACRASEVNGAIGFIRTLGWFRV